MRNYKGYKKFSHKGEETSFLGAPWWFIFFFLSFSLEAFPKLQFLGKLP
jgi:hypothetical protein